MLATGALPRMRGALLAVLRRVQQGAAESRNARGGARTAGKRIEKRAEDSIILK